MRYHRPTAKTLALFVVFALTLLPVAAMVASQRPPRYLGLRRRQRRQQTRELPRPQRGAVSKPMRLPSR
jgi:hypothetical protein